MDPDVDNSKPTKEDNDVKEDKVAKHRRFAKEFAKASADPMALDDVASSDNPLLKADEAKEESAKEELAKEEPAKKKRVRRTAKKDEPLHDITTPVVLEPEQAVEAEADTNPTPSV